MRNIYYVARTMLIILMLTFLGINATGIQRKFAEWLASPSSLDCKYIEMHKGIRR